MAFTCILLVWINFLIGNSFLFFFTLLVAVVDHVLTLCAHSATLRAIVFLVPFNPSSDGG